MLKEVPVDPKLYEATSIILGLVYTAINIGLVYTLLKYAAKDLEYT